MKDIKTPFVPDKEKINMSGLLFKATGFESTISKRNSSIIYSHRSFVYDNIISPANDLSMITDNIKRTDATPDNTMPDNVYFGYIEGISFSPITFTDYIKQFKQPTPSYLSTRANHGVNLLL